MENDVIDTLKPKTFHMIRKADESGVSGTGKVLDGVLWTNGWVNVMWRTDLDPIKRGHSSITFFDTFKAFEAIHIDSHPTNGTEIVWDDEVMLETRAELEVAQEDLKSAKDKLKLVRKELRELKSEIEKGDTEYDLPNDKYEV